MFAVAVALLALQSDVTSIHPENGVIAGKYAYILQEQMPIFRGDILETKWRSDGKRLAIVTDRKNSGREFRSGGELVVWNEATGRTKSLWKPTDPTSFLDNPNWIGNSNRLIAQVYTDNEKSKLIAIDTDTGTTKEVYSTQRQQMVVLSGPGNASIVAELDPDSSTMDVSVLTASLSLRKIVTLPNRMGMPSWAADGKNLLVQSYAANPIGNQMPKGMYSIDLASGRLTKTNEKEGDGANGPLSVIGASTNVSSDFESEMSYVDGNWKTMNKGLSTSWSLRGLVFTVSEEKLRSDNMALLTADGEEANIAPSLTIVSFKTQGGLAIRAIDRMDASEFKRLKDIYNKTKAMQEAKQVSLAIIMCGMDFDESLPSADGWQDKVMPYLKDRKMLGGFNYTFAGGAMPEDRAATTEIGFTQGPGGRAVAYGDGHVIWVPDK